MNINSEESQMQPPLHTIRGFLSLKKIIKIWKANFSPPPKEEKS
jgi:hypothetical protein